MTMNLFTLISKMKERMINNTTTGEQDENITTN